MFISLCVLYLQVLSFLSDVPALPVPYSLSLHDALPISDRGLRLRRLFSDRDLLIAECIEHGAWQGLDPRSEEHTSELQSRGHLVCRLLLEKKKLSENADTKVLLLAAGPENNAYWSKVTL